mmetsp:Transcript_34213/g.69949  ORF Transcript_34213/g.69949 Transcript_34213/m.69949 type:complete len:259 (+) Transcript_34213:140-916(+)
MSILVVGGAGCLGRAMLRRFAKHGSAISVDLAESPEATQSVVVVGEGGSCSQTSVAAADKVAAALLSCGLDSVETIVCTAGAWAGGSVASEEGLQAVDSMWQANVQSAVTTAHLATRFLGTNGLVVFSGAGAALGPTPGMAGYGVAKAATHQLASSLAASVETSVERQGGDLPFGASVATLLPNVIDTPANRQAMPDADFSVWASPDDIADMVFSWSQEVRQGAGGVDAAKANVARPQNGAFLRLVTENWKTSAEVLK